MKVVKKIFALIIITLVILIVLTVIDYYCVKNNDIFPRVAVKHEYKDKDMTIYNALFYKLYYCTSNNSKILVSYSDDEPTCPSKYKFENDYYTNSVSLKISKHDINIMTYNNIYTKEMIDIMSSNEEVNNALYVVNEYIKTKYKELDEKTSSNLDINYQLITFPEFIYDKDKDNYELKYDEKQNIYCLQTDNKTKEKMYSIYENGECLLDYKPLKMTDKWCELYKNSTLIYEGNNLCK